MAFYKEDIVDIELESGAIHRSFLNKTVGEGDIDENRFGFRCLRNGIPIQLTGSTVVGHFTRADGNTIQIDGGAVSGDTAYITLPQTCYAIEGQFSLAIKLTSGGVIGTIRIVDGTVINTTNGAIIDPGDVIPDLSEYLSVIEDAEAAAAIVNGFSVSTEAISEDDYMIIVSTGGD